VAVETVDDGCCEFVYDLTLQLSNPTGTPTNAQATAEVVAVTVKEGYDGPIPPAVGARGGVTIKSGIFRDPWFNVSFCEPAVNACGA
jgi:hypothetical protein